MTSVARSVSRAILHVLGNFLSFTVLAIALAGSQHSLRAQWVTSGSNVTTTDNVGIGTTSPDARLSLGSAISDYSLLLYDQAAYPYGFGIRNAQMLQYAAPTGVISFGHMSGVPSGTFTENVRIDASGNVGIGTSSPTNKLSVAGTVQAYEVLVNTGWSDYVFAPNYHLRPPTEVAAYIEQNHHLPDIPSAAEVREKGVSVGDMESKLLAKIEELTLHIIEADDRIRSLEDQNRKLLEKQGRANTEEGIQK